MLVLWKPDLSRWGRHRIGRQRGDWCSDLPARSASDREIGHCKEALTVFFEHIRHLALTNRHIDDQVGTLRGRKCYTLDRPRCGKRLRWD